MRFDIPTSVWTALARITPDNFEKYTAELLLLDPGVIATAVTGAVTAGVASVVSNVSLSHDHRGLVWFIEAASEEESFTLRLTVVTNDGQTLVFSVDYVVG